MSILAYELQTLLEEIDPQAMIKVRQGIRQIDVDVPASHAARLNLLLSDTDFSQLARFEEKGNFLWNDARGPRNGYIMIVTEEFLNKIT